MTSTSCFEILIGTYEEFVLGYQLIKTDKEEDPEYKYTLAQTFVTHSHTASVRSVAATSKLAASSGADETVVLYDMVKRKQSGAIMKQEGTITCLKFTPDGSHLISCSDDGSIAIFRVGSWQLEKMFKNAHKGTAVNHIAIHPSGKLAMSVGKDKTLRTWNLIKGRSAYITNLSSYGVAFENLDHVVWSPEGLLYSLPIQQKALVFSVEKAGILHTLASTCKVHCVCFLDETTVCTGNEESTITAYNLSDGSELWQVKASQSRIKGLIRHERYLICITSAGDLVVWSWSEGEDYSGEPEKVASTNDGCRFTCLTIRPPIVRDAVSHPTTRPKKKKKKSNAALIAELTSRGPSQSGPSVSFDFKPESASQEVEVINLSIGGETTAKKKMKKKRVKAVEVDEEEESGDESVKSEEEERPKKKKTKKGVKAMEVEEESGEEAVGGKVVTFADERPKKKLKVKKNGKSVKVAVEDDGTQDVDGSVLTTKKSLKRKSSKSNVEMKGGKGKKSEREEIGDDVTGKKKKKKLDQEKMVAKKRKRQGTFG